MYSGETIVAISSAVGPAARMIVRLSGPEAHRLAQELGARADAGPGSALWESLTFSGLTVPAWIYRFSRPRSYTGEDLVEFHLPGNPILVQMLLRDLMNLGARQAEPGEFTARAYFNGRIDLTEAEGVVATISAGSEQELLAARQLLSGELARRLSPLMEIVANTLALLEVGIDFSEEDVSFVAADEVRRRITEVREAMQRLLQDSGRFERISHEPQVVLVGRPNAGKSMLLNALSGSERAVVSPIAGTTRDVLWAHVILARGVIRMIDAAGLQETDPAGDAGSNDPHALIEQKMRQHALQAVQQADFVVLVRDITDSRLPLQTRRAPDMVICSKMDLLPAASANLDAIHIDLHLSAVTGAGMQSLRDRLDRLCFGESSAGSALALNLRHVKAIDIAIAALDRVLEQLDRAQVELLALDLREALDCLGSVLGKITPDDLLGRIFAGFCIGK